MCLRSAWRSLTIRLQVSEARFVEGAKKILVQAKETVSHNPLVIVIDGLHAYQSDVSDVFLREKGNFIQNPHVRLKDFETKLNHTW